MSGKVPLELKLGDGTEEKEKVKYLASFASAVAPVEVM